MIHIEALRHQCFGYEVEGEHQSGVKENVDLAISGGRYVYIEGMNDVIFGLRLFRLHLTRLLVLAIAIFPRRNEQKLPACPASKVARPYAPTKTIPS